MSAYRDSEVPTLATPVLAELVLALLYCHILQEVCITLAIGALEA